MIECPIAQMACLQPHHPAIDTSNQILTYRQLDAAVTQKTRELISPSDRLPFVATATLSSLLTLFALIRHGSVACPLSPRIPPSELSSLIQTLSPACHLRQGLATLLMTSGSTRHPKMACHTLQQHLLNASAAIPRLSSLPTSRWLLSLPLYHISGIALLFRCFLSGATLVIPPPAPIGSMLARHQITHASLVPTQLYRLLQEPQEVLATVAAQAQCLLIGGAPLPPALASAARQLHLPLFITYGMTEMSSIITLATPTDGIDTLGTPLYANSMQVESDGELCVTGPTLFQGYWDAVQQQPQLTHNPHPTRDLGIWNAHGQLTHVYRKDRMFISGGENIQPEEIERALCQISGILAAYVLPIDDIEFGQRPCAYLLEEKPHHTVASLREVLQLRLPSFKHPVEIRPWPPALEKLK